MPTPEDYKKNQQNQQPQTTTTPVTPKPMQGQPSKKKVGEMSPKELREEANRFYEKAKEALRRSNLEQGYAEVAEKLGHADEAKSHAEKAKAHLETYKKAKDEGDALSEAAKCLEAQTPLTAASSRSCGCGDEVLWEGTISTHATVYLKTDTTKAREAITKAMADAFGKKD